MGKCCEIYLNCKALCASRIPKSRDKVIENKESILEILIEFQAQLNVPVSLVMIQESAETLFLDLKLSMALNQLKYNVRLAKVGFSVSKTLQIS
jgi:hypothetical protein